MILSLILDLLGYQRRHWGVGLHILLPHLLVLDIRRSDRLVDARLLLRRSYVIDLIGATNRPSLIRDFLHLALQSLCI